jgi:hypothetical protein
MKTGEPAGSNRRAGKQGVVAGREWQGVKRHRRRKKVQKKLQTRGAFLERASFFRSNFILL